MFGQSAVANFANSANFANNANYSNFANFCQFLANFANSNFTHFSLTFLHFYFSTFLLFYFSTFLLFYFSTVLQFYREMTDPVKKMILATGHFGTDHFGHLATLVNSTILQEYAHTPAKTKSGKSG